MILLVFQEYKAINHVRLSSPWDPLWGPLRLSLKMNDHRTNPYFHHCKKSKVKFTENFK